MTQDLFMKLKEYITIYGDGRININTASKEVLLALGLSEDIVYKILALRYGEDGIEGTNDDNIFDTPSNIATILKESFQLNDAETAYVSTISERYLATASNHFMIRSIANLNNKKNTSETTCVVDQDGNILYWREP
jgi:type II secretory pathway component PulK